MVVFSSDSDEESCGLLNIRMQSIPGRFFSSLIKGKKMAWSQGYVQL